MQTVKLFYLRATLQTKNGRGFNVSRNIGEISTVVMAYNSSQDSSIDQW